jgi:hypothetical protein
MLDNFKSENFSDEGKDHLAGAVAEALEHSKDAHELKVFLARATTKAVQEDPVGENKEVRTFCAVFGALAVFEQASSIIKSVNGIQSAES